MKVATISLSASFRYLEGARLKKKRCFGTLKKTKRSEAICSSCSAAPVLSPLSNPLFLQSSEEERIAETALLIFGGAARAYR
jgi:hypothetical protein